MLDRTAVDGVRSRTAQIRRTFAAAIGLAVLVAVHSAAAAVITVDTLADNTTVDGRCSLREAVQAANSDQAVDSCAAGNGADTIVFAVTGVISLAAQIETSSDIVLSGPGARVLALDGASSTRLLRGQSGSLSVRGLTLQNASSDRGAAIRMDSPGNLTVQDVRITGGGATVFGSGIYFNSTGSLLLERSLLDSHIAGTQVVILNAQASAVQIRNTTFSGNSPGAGGEATVIHLSNQNAAGLTAVLDHVTISDGRLRNTSGSNLQYGNSVFAGAAVAGIHIDCSVPSRCLDAGGNYSDAPADNLGAAPLITPLGNYGGPTDSHALCTAAGVPHASCAASSDAVNGASSATTNEDQRGFSRDNNTTADAGAFESGGIPVIQIPSGGATATYDSSSGIVRIQSADGTELQAVPLSVLSALELVGSAGEDNVTVAAELAALNLTININLGDGFDTLRLGEGGTTGDITYRFDNATDGAISITGGATINYTGLDPIVDNMDAANRSFTFSGSAETIILSADGDGTLGNGYSFIDSEFAEQVVFKNPTSSLTINTGDGESVVLLGELDTPLAGTFSGITVNGGTDPDGFSVTPSTAYGISVDGGAPSGSCTGDGLLIDTSTGAVVDSYGATDVTFSSGHLPVSFAEIESLGPADLAVSANYEVLYATQDLATGSELVITVTNNGPQDANCVTVDIDAAIADWTDGFTATPEDGTVNGTGSEWQIDEIEAGESLTLTITGFVDPNAPQDVTFTLDAFQDTGDSNNTATVELSLGFTMPTKAHVNAALYYERTASAGTYDALIVGLYQGSPGIEGAVWCKIPSDAVGTWPAPIPAAAVGNHFRPCSDGLPFPLHVNDIYEDASGTLWLSTWGGAGLYRSDDEGQSWEESAPLGEGNNIVYMFTEDAGGILYASANNGLVIRSFNGGADWQEVSPLPGVASDTPWSLTAHPSAAGTIYAGTHGNGVFVSEDFGFTWAVLEDGSDENQDLIDGLGGHVFDLAFSPDADYLYAATGTGVWRAHLTGGATTFTGSWTLIGPTVMLDDASTVTPQIRALAFTGNGAGAPADDLVAGSWGFGAFVWDDPNGSSAHSQMTLREGQVVFVAGSPSGQVFAGTSGGGTAYLSASGAKSTATAPVQQELPDGYALSQNYPNPFNPVTSIQYALPETGHVRLAVYDQLGREVAVLVDRTAEAGHHTVSFDAQGLPTGAYLYRLETGQGAIARTLVLMK